MVVGGVCVGVCVCVGVVCRRREGGFQERGGRQGEEERLYLRVFFFLRGGERG